MQLEQLIEPEAQGAGTLEVTNELTVGYSVDGMPMVYSTPNMIHQMEVVCEASIRDFLPDGWVTVGIQVNVEHVAASPVGSRVDTYSKVINTNGRRVEFEVTAMVEGRVIGRGTHTRSAVELRRFEKALVSPIGASQVAADRDT